MKKILAIVLCAVMMLSIAVVAVYAEPAVPGTTKTSDGLLTIVLPNAKWYQLSSQENTEMFSDGDCAIVVNLYKNGDKLPEIASADDLHELTGIVVHYYSSDRVFDDYGDEYVGFADNAMRNVRTGEVVYTSNPQEPQRPTIIDAQTLYHADGTTLIVYTYSDWTHFDGNGDEYIGVADNALRNIRTGELVYSYIGEEYTEPEIISSQILYRADGSAVVVYTYSDWTYADDNGDFYEGVADNAMRNTRTGELVYTNPPMPDPGINVLYTDTMYRADGSTITIYTYSDYSHSDEDGYVYIGVADNAMRNITTGELIYSNLVN